MGQGQLPGDWTEVRGRVQWRWSELTPNDLSHISGNRELLIDILHERYGNSREQVAAEVARFETYLVKLNQPPAID